MDLISLSLDDLQLHVVSFGIDTYPQIDIAKNKTRLNTFYEEGCARFADLFQKLQVSDSEFEVSATFSAGRNPTRSDPSTSLSTFFLTPRGPVLNVPVMLPAIGPTCIPEDEAVDRFREVQRLFFRAIPDTKLLRVGMIRRLVFSTGDVSCERFISTPCELGSAELVGGTTEIKHKDDKCNVNVRLEPVRLMTTTKLAVGRTVTQPRSFGLDVQLDVNNSEIRPLEETDIDEVLERATSLWPNALLAFLNGRKPW